VVDGRTLLAAHSHAARCDGASAANTVAVRNLYASCHWGNDNLFNWFRRTKNLSAKLWRAPWRWREGFWRMGRRVLLCCEHARRNPLGGKMAGKDG
jgi:hypothetical protein